MASPIKLVKDNKLDSNQINKGVTKPGLIQFSFFSKLLVSQQETLTKLPHLFWKIAKERI